MMSKLIKCEDRLVTKLEMNNPGGSHKFRAASHIVNKAIETGEITPGVTTVIEKTGGNFGFGLLAACHRYDVNVELAIGLSFSKMKRDLLECFGAKLIGKQMLLDGATPKEVVHYHLECQESLGKHYFFTDQFQNSLGVDAHRLETGIELAHQLAELGTNRRVLFVGCAGTGASFTGVTQALIDMEYEVETALVEPQGCDMRADHFIDHRLEGMAVGVQPPFLDWRLVNEVHRVSLEDILHAQRWFYVRSGLHVGNTSAACLAVAKKLHGLPEYKDRTLVTIAYDSGLWYQDIVDANVSQHVA